jgi:hypothetical protein
MNPAGNLEAALAAAAKTSEDASNKATSTVKPIILLMGFP